MGGLKPYISAFVLRFRLETRYRAAALGGLATQVFFGFILVFLYRALYASGNGGNVPLAQTVSYVWLQQAFFRMIYSNDGMLIETIVTGGMAYQICRPIDQYAYWFARAAAQKLVGSLMRAVPMLLIAFTLPGGIGLAFPSSLANLGLSLMSLLFGLLCVCALDNIGNAATLRTLDHRGISTMMTMLMVTFSGNLLPLTLFPDRWQAWLRFIPYAQLLDTPIRLYTGAYPIEKLPAALFVQAAWVCVLVLSGRAMWRQNLKRIVVQGG